MGEKIGKVVLVEDQEIICASLSSLLEKGGGTVERYTDPGSFLSDSEKKVMPWNGVDAVVTDVNMPGVDGVELGLRLRKGGYAGLIVFITGLKALPLESYRRVLEPYVVVQKPFKSTDLLAILKIAGSQAGDPETVGFARAKFNEASLREGLPSEDVFVVYGVKGVRYMEALRGGRPWNKDSLGWRALLEGAEAYVAAGNAAGYVK